MTAPACTTCAHAHAPLPDGWAALDFFDRRAMAGQLSHRLDCTALPDADKPCLKPAAQAPAKAPGLAQAVTVQQPMRLGSPGLFTVRPASQFHATFCHALQPPGQPTTTYTPGAQASSRACSTAALISPSTSTTVRPSGSVRPGRYRGRGSSHCFQCQRLPPLVWLSHHLRAMSDDAAVDALAAAMKAKLAKQRAKGYGGWDTPECTQQRLSDMLRAHVDKGDPVDVANFCTFLAARGEGIAQAAPVARGDAEVLSMSEALMLKRVADAEDAARWRWLSSHIMVAWNEGRFTSLVRIVSDENRASLNASVDRMMGGDWSDVDAPRPQATQGESA